ncbi:MAG: hypothetical protein RL701_5154 [Pseudomonadota bacterium]|jgi:hypothetical protein
MQHKSSLALALFGSLTGWIAFVCTTGAVMAGGSLEFVPKADQKAELSLRVTNASDGSPLAVRLRIARVGAFEPRRVFVAADGLQTLELAAGEYRIWASRGPEWSVAETRTSLRPAQRRVLQLALSRQVEASGYVSCDLHVHTEASHDSKVDVTQRLASAAAEGLQFAVITDHNHVTELPAMPSSAETRLLPGVEVTTWDPEFGHFNVFPAASAPSYKHSTPERLLSALPAKSGRFMQVNHPRLMRHIGYFELQAAKSSRHGVLQAMRQGLDGLEVWNGYDLHRPAERDRVLSDWFELIRHKRRVVATGGSDSHDLVRTTIGYPRTYVELPVSARTDETYALQLAAALRAGRAFVSNGPNIELRVGELRPGDTLQLARGQTRVPVHVRVAAPTWMDLHTIELWVDGRRALTQPIAALASGHKLPNQARAEWAVSLQVGKGSHSIVAMVRGNRPMDELFDRHDVLPFAFTNPIWIAKH